ncbi:hypothetical protein J2Y41_000917 [Arthrobacter sp. 1088]|nr:hypothetical protein [Arthrobacter sp. 1088]
MCTISTHALTGQIRCAGRSRSSTEPVMKNLQDSFTGEPRRQAPPGPVSEGLTTRYVNTLKQKPPLTRGFAVPELGLEGDSRPWERWDFRESCRIRPDPTDVRPSPTGKVWTVSTPSYLPSGKAPHLMEAKPSGPPSRSESPAPKRSGTGFRTKILAQSASASLPSAGRSPTVHCRSGSARHDQPGQAQRLQQSPVTLWSANSQNPRRSPRRSRC